MKAFMITMLLIVAASIYVLTSYDQIADTYLAKVLAEEGTPEAMLDAAAKDETAFEVKYRPMLETRWKFCHIGIFIDDSYFLKLSKESLERYKDTPLKKDPAYGNILFKRAQMVEEKIKPPVEAFYLFKEHNENFGSTPESAISRSALVRLSIKYGMQ